MNCNNIRQTFLDKFKNGEFTTGRGGVKMIEILGASFIADEEAIFGTVNQEYVQKEIDWYLSQSTNVYDIEEIPPAAWINTANKHGEINSNYGHLIYSKKYYEQYYRVWKELESNHDTRRATMVYTRPSIWVEYDENKKNDFICTNAVTYYIREGKIHAVVQMRSNDIIFGYKNDRAWQQYVLEQLCNDVLLGEYEPGTIYWQVQNLHIYSRHFHLLEKELEK